MMLHLQRFRTIAALSAIVAASALFAAEPETGAANGKTPLKTAIFVRNCGGQELRDKIDTFNDRLSARLSEKGFSTMDWKDVIQKFKESSETEDQIFKNVKTFMAVSTTTATNQSLTGVATADRKPDETVLIAQGRDGGVAQASSLRIAQMIDANYIIVASMGQLGHEKRTFKGEGTIYQTNNTADIYTLPLTIRVLDGSTGQSLYGDTLTASYRVAQNASLEIKQDNIADNLIDIGTAKLAENISGKVERIRNAAVKGGATAEFGIECNVTGATVELDGAAIGSPPGRFIVKPGLHQLRVSREYFQTWERTVNIFPNQQLNVSLELSESGLAKYKDITAFKQAQELEKLTRVAKVDIAREQSKADADVKEKVSSGREVFLKNSYIRSDGFAQQLTRVIHGY
ncbi:MAG: PEGA domain-containing protein [Lentisphaerota bacterium]